MWKIKQNKKVTPAKVFWWVWLLWYCYDEGLTWLVQVPLVGQLHLILWLAIMAIVTYVVAKEDGA